MSTETTWYYADRAGRQQGPLSREDFLLLLEHERLSPDTLVWRDGLAQWQPLSSLAAELGQTTAAAIVQAGPLQAQVEQAWKASGRCPVNGEAGIRDADSYASRQLQPIHVGTMKNAGSCALELTLRAPGQSMLDGKRVWLTMDKDGGVTPTWHCSSELPGRYLPMTCRESNQQ